MRATPGTVRRSRGALRRLADAGPRGERLVLAIIFRLAPRFTRARAVSRTEGSVEWRIAHADGTASTYAMVFADDRCRTHRGARAEPDLTLTLSAADFRAVALDGAAAVALVFAGRMRVNGDIMLGVRVGRCFRR